MKKHEQITVVAQKGSGEKVTVPGFRSASPFFAVTPRLTDANDFPNVQDWTVTHIETGAAVAHYLSKRAAFKIAAAIGALMDWSGDDPAKIAPRFKALPQSWQRWARSWNY